MAHDKRPPGPPGIPFLGPIWDYSRDPFAAITKWQRAGRILDVSFPGMPSVMLSYPEDIEHVLVRNAANYQKDRFLREAHDIFGQGLLTSEGDLWKRQRRLMQPAFHKKRIDGYAAVMAESTGRAIADWRDGEVRAINDEMGALTLDVAVRTLFGSEVGGRFETVKRAMETLSEFATIANTMFAMVLFKLPTPFRRRYMEAIGELDGIVYGLIEERRASGAESDDLLSMLLHAEDEDGARMDDKQLRDEVMTLFLAGHETTALALTYTFFLLAENPEAERLLTEELDAVLAGRAPTVEDLPKLPYLEKVVKESMRLYPPAYLTGREALEDDEIAGYRVPKGTTVMFAPWGTHRDPRWFDEPEAFRPERWTPELELGLPRFAYWPFGGGQRMCIGAGFASMETRVVIATILGRFHLSRADDRPLKLQASITARPRHPVRMRVEKR